MKPVRVLLLAAAAAAFAGAAYADVSGLVGNTVVLTMGNGGQIKVQLHADGSYQTTTPQGTVKGAWKFDNGQLCYTQTDPAPPAGRTNPFCAPGMDGKKVGDTWSQQGPGGSMQGAVVAGQ